MALEVLGKLLYESLLNEQKGHLGIFLRSRPLNILECPESDIQYMDENENDSSVSADNDKSMVEQSKQQDRKTVILYNNNFDITEQFYLDESGNILTDNGVKVGYYGNWQDEGIPKRYRDGLGNVLNPETGQAIIEYVLEPNRTVFGEYDISQVYRPYRYDYYLDRFFRVDDVKN